MRRSDPFQKDDASRCVRARGEPGSARQMASIALILLCIGLSIGSPLQGADRQIAEQSWQIGDYVVHANAIRTDFLTQSVADKFEIERSNEKALITISVQRPIDSAPPEPVEVDLSVTANRASKGAEPVEMRTHRADEVIYYLGVLPILDGESIRFDIAITPAPDDRTHRFSFERYFFTD